MVNGCSRSAALIFDLDGTLWDAAAPSAEGWNLALSEMGVEQRVDEAGVRSVSGTPFEQCVRTLLPELCPPSEAILAALDAGERKVVEARGGTLYPGVAEGLRRLSEAYQLFVVSNCPDWYLEVFLQMTGLRGCFTAWDCHGSSGLPKAEMMRGLLQKHGLQRAIYVGDTHGDRQAAEAAGLEFAFVLYGFGCTEAPALVFADFGELVEQFLAGDVITVLKRD
jgi:phosphoglycolate phosphatase